MGTLGKGHFAKVKEVVHIEAQESYAVKILDKSHAENDVEDMVREFQMLRALRHMLSALDAKFDAAAGATLEEDAVAVARGVARGVREQQNLLP